MSPWRRTAVSSDEGSRAARECTSDYARPLPSTTSARCRRTIRPSSSRVTFEKWVGACDARRKSRSLLTTGLWTFAAPRRLDEMVPAWCTQNVASECFLSSQGGVVRDLEERRARIEGDIRGLPSDLYNADWIVHEPSGAPTSVELAGTVSEIGCNLMLRGGSAREAISSASWRLGACAGWPRRTGESLPALACARRAWSSPDRRPCVARSSAAKCARCAESSGSRTG